MYMYSIVDTHITCNKPYQSYNHMIGIESACFRDHLTNRKLDLMGVKKAKHTPVPVALKMGTSRRANPQNLFRNL